MLLTFVSLMGFLRMLAQPPDRGSAPRPVDVQLVELPSTVQAASAPPAVPATPPRSRKAPPPPTPTRELPRRVEQEVAAKPAPDFVYADVEPWLKSESPFRRQFVERWRVKARDKDFRQALIANLSSHPEWDPILFPEKYLPKDPPRPASGAASSTPPTASR